MLKPIKTKKYFSIGSGMNFARRIISGQTVRYGYDHFGAELVFALETVLETGRLVSAMELLVSALKLISGGAKRSVSLTVINRVGVSLSAGGFSEEYNQILNIYNNIVSLINSGNFTAADTEKYIGDITRSITVIKGGERGYYPRLRRAAGARSKGLVKNSLNTWIFRLMGRYSELMKMVTGDSALMEIAVKNSENLHRYFRQKANVRLFLGGLSDEQYAFLERFAEEKDLFGTLRKEEAISGGKIDLKYLLENADSKSIAEFFKTLSAELRKAVPEFNKKSDKSYFFESFEELEEFLQKASEQDIKSLIKVLGSDERERGEADILSDALRLYDTEKGGREKFFESADRLWERCHDIICPRVRSQEFSTEEFYAYMDKFYELKNMYAGYVWDRYFSDSDPECYAEYLEANGCSDAAELVKYLGTRNAEGGLTGRYAHRLYRAAAEAVENMCIRYSEERDSFIDELSALAAGADFALKPPEYLRKNFEGEFDAIARFLLEKNIRPVGRKLSEGFRKELMTAVINKAVRSSLLIDNNTISSAVKQTILLEGALGESRFADHLIKSDALDGRIGNYSRRLLLGADSKVIMSFAEYIVDELRNTENSSVWSGGYLSFAEKLENILFLEDPDNKVRQAKVRELVHRTEGIAPEELMNAFSDFLGAARDSRKEDIIRFFEAIPRYEYPPLIMVMTAAAQGSGKVINSAREMYGFACDNSSDILKYISEDHKTRRDSMRIALRKLSENPDALGMLVSQKASRNNEYLTGAFAHEINLVDLRNYTDHFYDTVSVQPINKYHAFAVAGDGIMCLDRRLAQRTAYRINLRGASRGLSAGHSIGNDIMRRTGGVEFHVNPAEELSYAENYFEAPSGSAAADYTVRMGVTGGTEAFSAQLASIRDELSGVNSEIKRIKSREQEISRSFMLKSERMILEKELKDSIERDIYLAGKRHGIY